jgi:hypothetical protein
MAVLTIKQTINGTYDFVSDIKDKSKSYYLFVGKPDSWADDQVPTVANNSIQQSELSIYQDLVYGKLIANTDVSFMIPKHSWTNNTSYSSYSHTNTAFTTQSYFVVTDLGEVYKCIYNNEGANSVVKPSLRTSEGTFRTGDGYIWKYMYTVDPTANTKFSTPDYIPVTENANVQSNAVPGTIDYLRITNPGVNYQVYEEGFLSNLVNSHILQLPNTSSPLDNYYTNSTIYLKAGGAAGQIRTIISYSGLDRRVLLDSGLDVSVNLKLANVQGTIEVGDVVTQNLVSMSYLYQKGFFDVGDTIVQSNTGAQATITRANTTVLTLAPNTSTNSFALSFPAYNTSDAPVLKTGTVTVSVGNNWVSSVSGTAFTTDYAAGDYIQVGASSNTALRRIMSVNSTVIVVDSNTPFYTNLVANIHYSMPSAITPTSITLVNRSGTVSYVNLNGQMVSFSNTQPSGGQFFPGEVVKQVDVNNVYQGANAVVAFSNTTTMFLSDVQGVLTSNLFLLGQSSNTKAHIDSVDSFPNITLTSPSATSFTLGQKIKVASQLGSPVGNATLVSSVTNPNDQTEYIIGPKVVIDGDGDGALAYAEVDLSSNNPSRQITNINLIDHGQGYTRANVSISSNTLYGSSATASAVVSPLEGHGANVFVELSATYAGISTTFSNAESESFHFPVYGSYRRIGIIEDPTFDDALLNLGSFDRVKLAISNKNGNNFVTGETVIQPSTNSSGVVVYANSTFVELQNVLDTFSANVAGDNIFGLHSKAAANTRTANVSYFQLLSNTESIINQTSGATASLVQAVSNTQIRISTIEGNFSAGDRIYDPVTNSYANIVSILVANGSVDATANFGSYFNQVYRLTLASNTGAYTKFERVTQAGSNASGMVISTNNEIDLVLVSSNGTFTPGDVVTDATSGATALVRQANNVSFELKLTGVAGTFTAGHTVTNQQSKGGVVANAYSVIVLSDAIGRFQASNSAVVGVTSGASSLIGHILYPDLERNSGSTIYLENMIPFSRSNTSNEKINIVIKF